MSKKILIEKRNDGHVFVLFPSLYYVEKDSSIEAICEIARIFSDKFYFRFTYKDKADISAQIEKIVSDRGVECLADELSKNMAVTVIKSDLCLFPKIAKGLNFDEVTLELIKDDGLLAFEQALRMQENDGVFTFVFSDNDGPYLIFDFSEFEWHSTIARIKEILKGNHR